MNGLVIMCIRLLFALAVILCLYAVVATAPSSDVSGVAFAEQSALIIDSNVVASSSIQPMVASAVAANEPVYMVVFKLLAALGVAALFMLTVMPASKPVAAERNDD